MKHYEIVLIVHPDQKEQISPMLEAYRNLVLKNKGKVHRMEESGYRSLEYPIARVSKAYYLVLNIEADNPIISELKYLFKFNNSILRSLIVRMESAVNGPSALIKKEVLNQESSEDGNPLPASVNKSEEKPN